MQTVLSRDQAKSVTGGRTPLVPVEYEQAIRSLQACSTIDDAKYWSDKSDALAAWAKIYNDDKAGNEARRLKLHAYRRMGKLAEELRPTAWHKPGPVMLLMEHGFTRREAVTVRSVGTLSAQKFDAAVSRTRPPAPSTLRRTNGRSSEAWMILAGGAGTSGVSHFRSLVRKHSAKALARGLDPDERQKAREITQECADWLDEFLQYLPKK